VAEVAADLDLPGGTRAKALRQRDLAGRGPGKGALYVDLVGTEGKTLAPAWGWVQVADGTEMGWGTIVLRNGEAGAWSCRRTGLGAVATASDPLAGVSLEARAGSADASPTALIIKSGTGRLLERHCW
jgi:hypothetical protein